MKKFTKALVSALIILVVLLSFSGCSGGIRGEEAKAHINAFLGAIETKDYEQAATFLHPERPADLEPFFEGLEANESLDFSSIEIRNYTGLSSTFYDSTVQGSAYSLKMNVLAGEKEIQMEIEVVRNDNGFGIYNIDVKP